MSQPPRGRYLTLVTRAMDRGIRQLGASKHAEITSLHPAEAADRLAWHLARVIEKGIGSIGEDQRLTTGLALTSQLIEQIARQTVASLEDEQLIAPASLLTGILGRRPDGQYEDVPEPLVPLMDTALMTNAPDEPRIGQQLASEIPSADRIDLVMAFIRRSGIQPLLPALRRHCESGRELRVLTTTYTGSTEARALTALQDLGAQIRVSYDDGTTRLHAKAWLFHRESGFTTAYVGSSNLTHSAQVTGLEWNLRFSQARNLHVIQKVAAVFDSYWHSGDFIPFDPEQFEAAVGRPSRAAALVSLSPVEVRPEPFQERLLEQIELSRQQGHHRNLLVSATGTGKTVMAAIDYARLRQTLPRARLLFVAHRLEILQQSLATFRHALRDAAFGELWVDRQRPQRFEHVFASIQSLHRSGLTSLDPQHFDIIVVDEFHHAEAATYRNLLEHLQPRELLGLTATPERADGLPVLDWFGGRIAAELRLWDAIDQHRLVPFAYYGIADSLDLRDVPWRRGRGYDIDGLTRLLTGNDAWGRGVVQAVTQTVGDVAGMRALGFCVSISHAAFMARIFNAAGIPSLAIWADTPSTERQAALARLARREVNVVFSVDLFNEGVDVPAVDTLLMLRPTDSPTLFLQQLGRGLRRHHDKPLCTVLDFVGQHRREFRFDRRLRALLGGSRAKLQAQVQAGFPYLPAGCHMQLDPVARQRVLENIQAAIPSRWTAKVEELRALSADGPPVTPASYIEATGLDLEDLYASHRCWTDLLEAAGLETPPGGPHEAPLRKAVGRMLHVDDALRLDGYQQLIAHETAPDPQLLSMQQRRLLRMLVASVALQVCPAGMSLEEAARLLWKHPAVLSELKALFQLLKARISHVGKALPERPTVPLTVHARYSRTEIQAAFGDGSEGKASVPTWREGVRWMESAQCDVFLVTLDKTGERFSPTTRYRDYAISRDLIHWESQSRTKASDPTGTRYRTHASRGSAVMIFARLHGEERGFHFLGPATYVTHQSDMPMQVTWKLVHPLPGDLFATFAAAVA